MVNWLDWPHVLFGHLRVGFGAPWGAVIRRIVLPLVLPAPATLIGAPIGVPVRSNSWISAPL